MKSKLRVESGGVEGRHPAGWPHETEAPVVEHRDERQRLIPPCPANLLAAATQGYHWCLHCKRVTTLTLAEGESSLPPGDRTEAAIYCAYCGSARVQWRPPSI